MYTAYIVLRTSYISVFRVHFNAIQIDVVQWLCNVQFMYSCTVQSVRAWGVSGSEWG